MDLLQHIADVGMAIFIGIASWIGIFFIIAVTLQWAKDILTEYKHRRKTDSDYYEVYDEALGERERIKLASEQEPWGVE